MTKKTDGVVRAEPETGDDDETITDILRRLTGAEPETGDVDIKEDGGLTSDRKVRLTTMIATIVSESLSDDGNPVPISKTTIWESAKSWVALTGALPEFANNEAVFRVHQGAFFAGAVRGMQSIRNAITAHAQAGEVLNVANAHTGTDTPN
jgi:hypothetical protein